MSDIIIESGNLAWVTPEDYSTDENNITTQWHEGILGTLPLADFVTVSGTMSTYPGRIRMFVRRLA